MYDKSFRDTRILDRALDQGYGTDAVYLDYQKAFDTVPHERLISKLSSYGIRGQILHWIKDFLTNRRIRTKVRESVSEWSEVTSGVPQGSVLGPTLFLVYVNDIPEIVNSSIKLFADDTKAWRVLKTEEDRVKLQQDLDSLEEWSRKWLLKFNASKCKVMHIGRKNTKASYFMGEGDTRSELEETETEKDLGVWISNTLKPATQCKKAANKAMEVLRGIKRSFRCIDKKGFIILFKTYVRPHLEYCEQAWNPYYKKDISCLEKVQRRATKMVKGLRNLSYEQRLQSLGLYSLEQRRLRGDLIETYKLVTGKENVDYKSFFTLTTNRFFLRGHTLKIEKRRSNLNIRQNFFSQRVVGVWNDLPQHVIDATSVNAFKYRLDNYWKL